MLLLLSLLLISIASAQNVIRTTAGTDYLFNFTPRPGTSVALDQVNGVTVGASGNVIASSLRGVVVKITPDGTLSVLAGNGVSADTGDGGAATNAGLDYPSGL